MTYCALYEVESSTIYYNRDEGSDVRFKTFKNQNLKNYGILVVLLRTHIFQPEDHYVGYHFSITFTILT